MADVMITYDDVELVGSLVVRLSDSEQGLTVNVRRDYIVKNDGSEITALGKKAVERGMPWADLPTNIKDALTTINSYLTDAAKEDAGLT